MSDEKALEAVSKKEVKVTIGGREFTVRELSYRQRVKLYELLASAVASLTGSQLQDLRETGPLQALPTMVRLVGPHLLGIFSMILGESEDWIDQNLSVEGEAALLEAIVEVNDFPLLISRMKGAFGKLGQKLKSSSGSPAGSGGSPQS